MTEDADLIGFAQAWPIFGRCSSRHAGAWVYQQQPRSRSPPSGPGPRTGGSDQPPRPRPRSCTGHQARPEASRPAGSRWRPSSHTPHRRARAAVGDRLARSIEAWARLRALGCTAWLTVPALIFSYAMDVEVAWFGRFGAPAAAGTPAGPGSRGRAGSTSWTRTAWRVYLSPARSRGATAAGHAAVRAPGTAAVRAQAGGGGRGSGFDQGVSPASRSSLGAPNRNGWATFRGTSDAWPHAAGWRRCSLAARLLAGTQRLRIVDPSTPCSVGVGRRPLGALLQRRGLRLRALQAD